MKIAIVQFPGSNCERETMLAVQRSGMSAVEFLWNEAPEKLREMDGYIIVGGFSYEDRSRSGIIAALDPVMQEIGKQSEQGKPVLGICNGAQILVESGLVPGLNDNQVGMALTENKRILDGKILGTGFYNNWIYMRPCARKRPNAFTKYLDEQSILFVPTAHAEGRFVMPEELLNEISAEGLNLFQYCDEQGKIIDNFPINPNGSLLNTAAVINKAGNIMAMMPHPERTEHGDAIFKSMRDYILARKEYKPELLAYTPIPSLILSYPKDDEKHQLLVKLIITDNHALTVQNTLKQAGIPVGVTRIAYWQIECSSPEIIEQIKQTGVLYNERKEYLLASKTIHKTNTLNYLVLPKDDLLGQQKVQILQDHCSVDGVQSIRSGILWSFTSNDGSIDEYKNALLDTNIFFNPNSHDCYEY